MIGIDDAIKRARNAGLGEDRIVFTLRTELPRGTWRMLGDKPAAAFHGTGPMIDMQRCADGVYRLA